jgi:hypothetical protein
MNKSIVCFVGLLGLVACHVEHYDDAVPGGDCDKVDPFGSGDDFAGTHSGYAGSKASGGTGGSTSTAAGAGGGATAATAGSSTGGGSAQNGGDAAGEAGAPATAPAPCAQERDCAPGYNCDLGQHQCLPADQETCGELDTELACTNRKDCTPVYGGINCSCGNNCECHGGEPGCVCESFQFFVCQTAM